MRILDLLRFGFMNLWRRKVRSVLTVLGMVIGITSIVVMVSLGLGIEKATIDAFAGTGSLTMIQVSSYKYIETTDGNGTSTETKLDKNSVMSFRQIDGVVAAMPMINAYGGLKSGKYVSDISIVGVDAEQAQLLGFDLSEGRYPESRAGSRYEIVLGSYVLDNFVNPSNWNQAVDRNGNPLVTMDSRFKLSFDMSNIYPNWYGDEGTAQGKVYSVTPVGVMSAEGNDYSYYCLMNIETLEKLYKANETYLGTFPKTYNQVLVKCESIDVVESVRAQIDGMGYGTYSLIDAVNMAKESTQRIRVLLGAIGGVSLLVAAIGIMNTMMMSIYERTKEIGIIKVLGMRMSNIVGLFLCESAFIGFFGGIAGLALSFSISALINKLLASSGLTSIITGYLAVGAVAFSILVALISGLYPAIRAMRLSPLTAIRSE
ncbi:MAG TPA: ABC transporter permease [Eubacteriales bacterium]|nr:ABC transporter permease [Eubacteriales bacterium]